MRRGWNEAVYQYKTTWFIFTTSSFLSKTGGREGLGVRLVYPCSHAEPKLNAVTKCIRPHAEPKLNAVTKCIRPHAEPKLNAVTDLWYNFQQCVVRRMKMWKHYSCWESNPELLA